MEFKESFPLQEKSELFPAIWASYIHFILSHSLWLFTLLYLCACLPISFLPAALLIKSLFNIFLHVLYIMLRTLIYDFS
jgi:hypothetical protein